MSGREQLARSQGAAIPHPVDLDVIVLGGAAVDWVVEVDALPARDGLAVARSCARYPGGSAANIAAGLARLGRRVGFIGQVGDDADGQFLLQAFVSEGVDTRGMWVASGRPTAACFIAVDAEGERIIVVLPGASIVKDADGLDLALLGRCRALLIGPSYPAVAAAAARAAHDGGAAVLAAPDGAWTAADLPSLAPVLAQLDLLILSKSEAQAITGQDSPAGAARWLSAAGAAAVILTLGAQGALVLEGGRVWDVPAFAAPVVRDTTGAGDAFAAGLVAGFLDGLDWPAATRQGNATAALKIGHRGARGGLPTRTQLEQFLQGSQEGAEK